MWSDPNGTVLVFWWKCKYSSGKFISYLKSRNNLCIQIRSARLLDARWCVKMIWLSIFIGGHATLSLNQIQEYCFVLTRITLLNVIRKLKADNISKSWSLLLRFDGEYFHAAGSTKFSHMYTSGMANYKNQALTTGCGYSSSCYVKTELMNMETLQWSNGPDFPFGS